jgi:hypothetical protein
MFTSATLRELKNMTPEERQTYYHNAENAARSIYGLPPKKEKTKIPKGVKLKKKEEKAIEEELDYD